MSEASAPSRHSVSSLLKDNMSTVSSNTNTKFETVARKLPRLAISQTKYYGPGYSCSQNPYLSGKSRIASRDSSSRNSVAGSIKYVSHRSGQTPLEETSSSTVLTTPKARKRPRNHKGVLKKKSGNSEPTITAQVIMEILRQAKEGNKNHDRELMNPYLQSIPENTAIDSTEPQLETTSTIKVPMPKDVNEFKAQSPVIESSRKRDALKNNFQADTKIHMANTSGIAINSSNEESMINAPVAFLNKIYGRQRVIKEGIDVEAPYDGPEFNPVEWVFGKSSKRKREDDEPASDTDSSLHQITALDMLEAAFDPEN